MHIIKRFTPEHKLSNSYITTEEHLEAYSLLETINNPNATEAESDLAAEWIEDLTRGILSKQLERTDIYWDANLITLEDIADLPI